MNVKVTIEPLGQECKIQSASHSFITCTTPPGYGSNLTLFVIVQGQPASNNLSVSYSPPDLVSINPKSGPTSGNYPLDNEQFRDLITGDTSMSLDEIRGKMVEGNGTRVTVTLKGTQFGECSVEDIQSNTCHLRILWNGVWLDSSRIIGP